MTVDSNGHQRTKPLTYVEKDRREKLLYAIPKVIQQIEENLRTDAYAGTKEEWEHGLEKLREVLRELNTDPFFCNMMIAPFFPPADEKTIKRYTGFLRDEGFQKLSHLLERTWAHIDEAFMEDDVPLPRVLRLLYDEYRRSGTKAFVKHRQHWFSPVFGGMA